MNSLRTTLITFFMSAVASTSVSAAPVCNKLSLPSTSTASIALTPCYANPAKPTASDPLSQLRASQQFPDVSNIQFPDADNSYIGVCYVSTAPFYVLGGADTVKVTKTISAWTSTSSILGTEIGTVATQWTIIDQNGSSGQIYTRDTLNLNPTANGEEADIIIAGTNIYAGIKGTLELTSVPSNFMTTPPYLPGIVTLSTLSGTVCIN